MTLCVLMSVYEKETGAHLKRSLDSIWDKQTRKPDQVILVQDGPLTKELYDVIDEYKAKMGDTLVCPMNEVNSGLVVSLNKGLEYVKCDLVARMDSDDISSSDRFEKQVRFMEENPLVDVSSGSLQEFNDENPCVNVRRYPKSDFKKYIAKASPLAHAASVMKMKIFRDGDIRYNPKYKLNEDIALWFDVLKKGYQMSNIDDIIYFVDCNDGMIQRRSKMKAKTEFLAYVDGIYSLYGLFTWRYFYPISRLIFRYMPSSIISFIYGSSLRRLFLQKK